MTQVVVVIYLKIFPGFLFLWGAERMPETNYLCVCWLMKLPSAGLLPKCSQQPGLSQAKTRSPNFLLGFPHGWQRPKYLIIMSCLSLHTSAGSWSWEWGGVTARHSVTAHGHLNQHVKVMTVIVVCLQVFQLRSEFWAVLSSDQLTLN